jgi:hypothetical protein
VAVVHLNQLVRQRGSSANLTGVWRLVEGYEQDLTSLLQKALPGNLGFKRISWGVSLSRV